MGPRGASHHQLSISTPARLSRLVGLTPLTVEASTEQETTLRTLLPHSNTHSRSTLLPSWETLPPSHSAAASQIQIGPWPNAVPTPEHARFLVARWEGREAGNLIQTASMDYFQFGVCPLPSPKVARSRGRGDIGRDASASVLRRKCGFVPDSGLLILPKGDRLSFSDLANQGLGLRVKG